MPNTGMEALGKLVIEAAHMVNLACYPITDPNSTGGGAFPSSVTPNGPGS